jgi:hypothetical protein
MGTGELLLGLLMENEAVAAQVLMNVIDFTRWSLDHIRLRVDEGARVVDEDVVDGRLQIGPGEARPADAESDWPPPPPEPVSLPARPRFVPPSPQVAGGATPAGRGLLILILAAPLVGFVAWAAGAADGSDGALMGGIGILLLGLLLLGLLAFWAALQSGARAERRLDLSALLTDADKAWDGGTLARNREALENAIASKFGPLDDARRAALQEYDQRRIADVARRLSGAEKIDDLDGGKP